MKDISSKEKMRVGTERISHENDLWYLYRYLAEQENIIPTKIVLNSQMSEEEEQKKEENDDSPL